MVGLGIERGGGGLLVMDAGMVSSRCGLMLGLFGGCCGCDVGGCK